MNLRGKKIKELRHILIFTLTSLFLVAVFGCQPVREKKEQFVYPGIKFDSTEAKEIKAEDAALSSKEMAPASVVKEEKGDDGFIPPPLSPSFAKEESARAQERAKKVDTKFKYTDKKLKELIQTFPFIKIKKLARIDYLEHDMEMIKEAIEYKPITRKNFLALNALKEGYLYYTKKSKMYKRIAKKIAKNEKLSSRQDRLVKAINNMYFMLRAAFINEETDYRIKELALRYMKESRGKVILDFFIKDELEEIISSKDAPRSLIKTAKNLLGANK